MMPVCLSGAEVCVETYADAGKPCTSHNQCLGQCLYQGDTPPPTENVVGECQRTSYPCGCFTRVEDGKAADTECVD